MSVLEKLTEGIVNRDLAKEGATLLEKWDKTGLLEGIGNDTEKGCMARLLENQAKELLREASTMASGDVEGFASVAFPLVRRVFGSLIANDLVSVQPMSLPSGLIFFLDFTTQDAKLGYEAGDSLYGGGVVGQSLTGGVTLTGEAGEDGPYSLNNGYSAPTASAVVTTQAALIMHGTASTGDDDLDRAVRFDPDLSGSVVIVCAFAGEADIAQLDMKNLVATTGSTQTGFRQIRRLTEVHSGSTGNLMDPTNTGLDIKLVYEATTATAAQIVTAIAALDGDAIGLSFTLADNFNNVTEAGGRGVGAVVGADTWGLENQSAIPEIDLKVDSVSVTAVTKKLKAKWTPELGQDLNAYHNLDAEVELTGILSEQIALEIDREILEDLIKGATGGTLYWSRAAGKFVNRETGAEIGATTVTPDFTGTVSEWYETLCETINDVSARIHRKTLRGGANFVVCSPEVANILEFTAGFRAEVGGDFDRGSIGAVRVGALSKKQDVYVDPYFPRNVILVGRKGSSFLESGYVYAPYVPLQVTPTIFGIEDFVPRKGVMTRYAKKMVRPDMYGLVVVADLV
jgi:hypothetical protein|tara:strand:+ start:11221 stop:12933 length:1713 start_codon:yes stop_codon:yes gene_type:complete